MEAQNLEKKSHLTPSQATPSQVSFFVRGVLEDMKAENTVEIDVGGKTSIADTIIITSGRSQRHVGAIAENLRDLLKKEGYSSPPRLEGMPHCDWVVIDANEVIVHIFRPDLRGFYDLEKMWGENRPQEAGTSGKIE